MRDKKKIAAKIFTGLFSSLFIILTGFLIYSALQPEKMPVGALMPEFEYRTEQGTQTLHPDSTRLTVVVYFNTSCPHCRSLLNSFNCAIDELNNPRLIFITDDDDFFASKDKQEWPNLTNADNITWGIVSHDVLFNSFAPRFKPVIYIFDRTSKLVSKINGQTKIKKIVAVRNAIMNNKQSPQSLGE